MNEVVYHVQVSLRRLLFDLERKSNACVTAHECDNKLDAWA